MLHSFWYEEAEKQFLQIEKDDPKCAIAHWGVAMSCGTSCGTDLMRPCSIEAAAEFKQARSLPATPREKDYIAALSEFYAHPESPYQKRAYSLFEGNGEGVAPKPG